MKLSTKIIGGFSIVILLTLGAAGASLVMIQNINAMTNQIDQRAVPMLLKTEKITTNAALQVAAARGFIITGDESNVKDYETLYKENSKLLDELYRGSLTEQGKKLAQESKLLAESYGKLAEKAIGLKRSGKTEEITPFMRHELTPAAQALREKLNEYIIYREKNIQETLRQSQALGSKIDTPHG